MTVILTLDPSVALDKALPGLRAAHFRVDSVLENLHMVAGDGDAAALARVQNLPYVMAVEQDTMVRLDPSETPDMGRDWPAPSDQTAVPKVTGATWRSPAWDDGKT